MVLDPMGINYDRQIYQISTAIVKQSKLLTQ